MKKVRFSVAAFVLVAAIGTSVAVNAKNLKTISCNTQQNQPTGNKTIGDTECVTQNDLCCYHLNSTEGYFKN